MSEILLLCHQLQELYLILGFFHQDFLWIPDWKLDPSAKYTDGVKGVFKCYFMTFHVNGDVCIWKLVVSKTVIPKYAVTVVYTKSGLISTEDDIISSSVYSFVTSDFGRISHFIKFVSTSHIY